jgi:hypothetical protein
LKENKLIRGWPPRTVVHENSLRGDYIYEKTGNYGKICEGAAQIQVIENNGIINMRVSDGALKDVKNEG